MCMAFGFAALWRNDERVKEDECKSTASAGISNYHKLWILRQAEYLFSFSTVVITTLIPGGLFGERQWYVF